MAEGTIVFPEEPILEVDAPIAEAQLAESFLLNQITLQTTLATKAARCNHAAGGRAVIDLALRRTQGIDAAVQEVFRDGERTDAGQRSLADMNQHFTRQWLAMPPPLRHLTAPAEHPVRVSTRLRDLDLALDERRTTNVRTEPSLGHQDERQRIGRCGQPVRLDPGRSSDPQSLLRLAIR